MMDDGAKSFCPLYREARQSEPWDRATSAHAGLLFDKYADAWWRDLKWKYAFDKGNRSKKECDQKEHEKEGHWLTRLFPRRYSASRRGLDKLLTEVCDRQRVLVEKLGGRVFYLKNTDRFVTGMGRQHPLENGFAWHHTLGVPYLPGSSLKGMFRAWMREETGSVGKDNEGRDIWNETTEIKSHFGELGQAGQILFFDMLPLKPPQLDIDVMTPHYGPYYQEKEGDDIPGDWHSPVPISFLTVAPGQSWQVGLAPASRSRSPGEDVFASLLEALQVALAVAGAGAKTAVGYGRFERDLEAEERQAKEGEQRRRAEEEAARQAAEQAAFEESLANDSEPLRRLKRLQREQNWKRSADDSRMINALQKFVEENPNLPPDCINWIRDWLESIPNYRGVWDNPDATKGKKDKPKYSSKNIRELVKRLREKRD